MRENIAAQCPLRSGKILKVHEGFGLVKKCIRGAGRGSLGIGKQGSRRRIVSRAEFSQAAIKGTARLRRTSKSTKKQEHHPWKPRAGIGAALHGFGDVDEVAGSSI